MKIAIQGHPTRGKEVIQFLKSEVEDTEITILANGKKYFNLYGN